MVINSQQSDVELIGDIQEFKTSVDPKNLDFITTLLSSNLYSNPEQSFIRETVSNAWDSHVEAGTTDIPIIIKFAYGDDGYNISIRDFGTGLSPERFKEVYCNIGSSTKRGSNEFIGGFGIGRFAALSCSSTVYITSYYNGTIYQYIMVKSGNSITINLVATFPTEEKNGVEVTINNIPSFLKYVTAINSVVFFPNIYVCGINSHYLDPINNIKIKHFEHFAVSSNNRHNGVLIGNVLYPLDHNFLSRESKDFLHKIYLSGIVTRLDIGQVDITPNRESIIYTENTIAKLNSKIQKVEEELLKLIDGVIKSNYDNLEEFNSIVNYNLVYNPLTNSIEKSGNPGYMFSIDKDKITLNNRHISSNRLGLIKNFFMSNLPSFRGIIYNEKVYSNKLPYKIQSVARNSYNKILVIKNAPRITQTIKKWIIENYPDYTLINPIDKKEFSEHFKTVYCNYYLDQYPKEELEFIIEEAFKYLTNKTVVIDFKTNESFIQYKEYIKKYYSSNTSRDVNTNIILYLEYSRKEFYSLNDCIKYLTSLKKGIILDEYRESSPLLEDAAKINGMIYVRASKPTVRLIEERGLSCIVNHDKALNSRKISELHTVVENFKDSLSSVTSIYLPIIEILPKNIREEYKTILQFYNYYTNLKDSCHKINDLLANSNIDPYINDKCVKLVNYIKSTHNICAALQSYFSSLSSCKSLLAYAIMKNKIARLDYNVYKKLRHNILLNILCIK